MPWPALALCVWQASPAMNTRGVRAPSLVRRDVVEPVGEAVADLVDAVPRDVAARRACRVQDLVRLRDDLLDRGLAHGAVVVCGDLTEVDVHAEQVAALARDEQDVAAVVGLDRALACGCRGSP